PLLEIFLCVIFNYFLVNRHLHSFPTRRSSDLLLGENRVLARETYFLPSFNESRSFASVGMTAKNIFRQASRRKMFFAVIPTEAKDRKSTRLNSSHVATAYAVFCLKKKRAKISY